MPSSKTVEFPLANYPSGTRTLNEKALPDWATQFTFEFLRCTTATPTVWPNESTTLEISFEVEVDGVWYFGGAFSSKGGIYVDPDTGEAPVTSGMFPLRPGVGRKIRGSATITNGPLRTQGSLELVG